MLPPKFLRDWISSRPLEYPNSTALFASPDPLNEIEWKCVYQNCVMYSQPDRKSSALAYPEREDIIGVFVNRKAAYGYLNGYVSIRFANKNGYIDETLIGDYVPVFSSESFISSDPLILNAETAGYKSQYINIKSLFPKAKSINYNLCGEFSVAQVVKADISDFLIRWNAEDKNANKILISDSPTGNVQIQSMLNVYGFDSEVVNVANLTPDNFVLPCIAGVGIDGMGRIELPGTTSKLMGGNVRHWVTVYAVEKVLGSAYIWLYNPIWNRMETVLLRNITENKLTMIGVKQ